jgi:hypothetical protein
MAKRTVNRMDKFVIREISSVDLPAQIPAKALILKAAKDEDLRKRLRLLSNEDGHTHLLDDAEEGGHTSHDKSPDEEYGHSHPWVRNSDGSITIGMADGHAHSILEKRLTQEECLSKVGQDESAGDGGGRFQGENPMTKTEEPAADQAVNKRIEELEKRAARAERLAGLSDLHKAHLATLQGADAEAFLGLSPEQRQSVVEKAKGDDPVVYTTLDGQEIRKSAGQLVLSLAKRADESERNLAAEKATREREVFKVRAKDELGNLPGDEDVQVALLKAIDGIRDEKLRKGALEILKAANSGVKQGFEKAGTQDGGEGAGEANAQLEKMAQDHFTKNGGSFAKSYKAVLETPAGRKLYRESKAVKA